MSPEDAPVNSNRNRDGADRSSLTRWRQRMGEQRLAALVPGSLAVATRTGAAKPADFSKVIVDTTVQPKAVAFPTDAKLMHRARERLAKLARKTGLDLRQSDARVGKHALIAHQRYAHVKQFKRANRALRTIRTYLGRVIRDIGRKIRGEKALEALLAHELTLARRVREQRQHQRGRKVYLLHAPEVECIGKGKAHRPYEFGVKVSLATTLNRSKGGQFIAHAKALPGDPYDGHTLAAVIPEIETQIGANLARIVADRGYRGHNAPPEHKFKVYISGQRRRVTETIKRQLRRRPAVEPVIGHAKAEHRMGRNYLAGTQGDAANAILAAAGYNFPRLLEWLALLSSIILDTLHRPGQSEIAPHRRVTAFFTVDSLGRSSKRLGTPKARTSQDKSRDLTVQDRKGPAARGQRNIQPRSQRLAHHVGAIASDSQ